MDDILLNEKSENVVNIKVIGVGGGGGNAVNRMIDAGITSVDYIAINTDQAILTKSKAVNKMRIGDKCTKGLGVDGDPVIGQRAAEESREEIAAALKGTDMIFIISCMGGGTGTGASPIIASIARELGILTIGIVTKPFAFEGRRRKEQAEKGIAELRKNVDSLTVIPNERIKSNIENVNLANAFSMADDFLCQYVQSISDLLNIDGYINLDFDDVKMIMSNAGYAYMGFAFKDNTDTIESAIEKAITNPLLETSIDGAKGIIVNLTVSTTFDLDETDGVMEKINENVHPDANFIWGVACDKNLLCGQIKVTIIATGLDLGFDEIMQVFKNKNIDNANEEPALNEQISDDTIQLNIKNRSSLINSLYKKSLIKEMDDDAIQPNAKNSEDLSFDEIVKSFISKNRSKNKEVFYCGCEDQPDIENRIRLILNKITQVFKSKNKSNNKNVFDDVKFDADMKAFKKEIAKQKKIAKKNKI